MTRRFKGMFAAGAALCASAVTAETLPVNGLEPAGKDAAAALGVIALEPFGGSDGQQLAIAVADRLRAVTIDGEPYFRILPTVSPAEADAVLDGTAAAEVGRRDSGSREEQVCVERDEDDKCIRRETRHIPCWDHVVRLDAAVRLIAIDGAMLHAADRQDELIQRYCQGDGRPSSEGMVRELAGRYADALRADLAPFQRFDQIRVMESRKGLSKQDSRAFREAIRLTKSDGVAACAAWMDIAPRNPAHASVLFNLGLCAESAGRRDEAYDYYRRILAADDDVDYARQGARRIERYRRAEAQLASHRRL